MTHRFFKIFISLVVCIYVFSTIGISVISHYCGGELEKVSLFSKPDSCCGEEEETDMEDGCCKNETTHISFQQDFTFNTLVSDCKAPVNQLFILEPTSVCFSKLFIIESIRLFNIKDHPPNFVQQKIVSTSVLLI